ncbi:hypothetical protein [Capnocytophaga felis]|uniref:Uncharacterized protein n=1 Tax=Capnocytophaga felis TaxID=2267611 RepID=A0A5M4BBZ6_9FLAO|nr:hypothetical protein [Capnocytophaga felis]GET46980.1 hypothetical protein RCZ01_22820 [Capnocytophaga felis]GET49500.1 hypothetical protein RCZ02_23310 [Capnocytophaga felis]
MKHFDKEVMWLEMCSISGIVADLAKLNQQDLEPFIKGYTEDELKMIMKESEGLKRYIDKLNLHQEKGISPLCMTIVNDNVYDNTIYLYDISPKNTEERILYFQRLVDWLHLALRHLYLKGERKYDIPAFKTKKELIEDYQKISKNIIDKSFIENKIEKVVEIIDSLANRKE